VDQKSHFILNINGCLCQRGQNYYPPPRDSCCGCWTNMHHCTNRTEDENAATNHALRVSSKQTNHIFGSNRNKPKLNLFRLIFGLFRETKNYFFRFVSVRFGVSYPFRNKRNKQICFETNRNKRKIQKKQKTSLPNRAEKNCRKRSTVLSHLKLKG
jgi:hypothetical protein